MASRHPSRPKSRSRRDHPSRDDGDRPSRKRDQSASRPRPSSSSRCEERPQRRLSNYLPKGKKSSPQRDRSRSPSTTPRSQSRRPSSRSKRDESKGKRASRNERSCSPSVRRFSESRRPSSHSKRDESKGKRASQNGRSCSPAARRFSESRRHSSRPKRNEEDRAVSRSRLLPSLAKFSNRRKDDVDDNINRRDSGDSDNSTRSASKIVKSRTSSRAKSRASSRPRPVSQPRRRSDDSDNAVHNKHALMTERRPVSGILRRNTVCGGTPEKIMRESGGNHSNNATAHRRRQSVQDTSKVDNILLQITQAKMNFEKRKNCNGYDTKSSSGSECEPVEPLTVKKLPMARKPAAAMRRPSNSVNEFQQLQNQLVALDFVVPASDHSTSNSTTAARPKFHPPVMDSSSSLVEYTKPLSQPPERILKRSSSLEAGSTPKPKPPPRISRRHSMDAETRQSSTTPPPPPPPPRRNFKTGEASSGVKSSSGMKPSGSSQSTSTMLVARSPTNSAANSHDSPSPPPQEPATDSNPSANSAANKRLLNRIQRSNQVTNMPYTDPMGDAGLYTGEVDPESRVPHGKGKMKYENGIFYEGTWVNGAQDSKAATQRERILSGFTSWKGKSKNEANGDGGRNVYGMDWVDFKGMSGRYTGTVNKSENPNGRGVMRYDCGLIAEGHWINGVLDDGSGGMAAAAATMAGCGATVVGGGASVASGSGAQSVFNGGMSVMSGLGMMSIGGTGGMGMFPGGFPLQLMQQAQYLPQMQQMYPQYAYAQPGMMGGASVAGFGMNATQNPSGSNIPTTLTIKKDD